MMLALVRPDSWNFPLFLHVLGAGVLVGAIGATVIIATRAPSWRRLLVRTIGFLVGDAGLLLLVITALIAWWGMRHPERRWPVKAVAVISGLYLIALFIAMWAMTTKPD